MKHSNYFVDLADVPVALPACTPVPCTAVPCRQATSGWLLVGIAFIGLTLNGVKFFRSGLL